jgi:predicted transcriptional regulator YheO
MAYFKLQTCTSHKNDKKSKSTTHNSATMSTVVSQQASWVLQRVANAQQVENDQRKAEAYIKNILFEKVVFVWEKSSLDQGGKLLLEELQGIACRRETDQHWG